MTKESIMEQIKENIKIMLDQIAAKDPVAAQTFQDIVQAKISASLEDMKVEVGQGFFGAEEVQEDTEQLDELSGGLLGRYVQKTRQEISDKRDHNIELDNLPKVKALKAKLTDYYGRREYTKSGDSKYRKQIDNAHDKINDTKKKYDPDYPASVSSYKRTKGLDKAIKKLQYGKLSEQGE